MDLSTLLQNMVITTPPPIVMNQNNPPVNTVIPKPEQVEDDTLNKIGLAIKRR